jgi:hypothetical protein
VLENLEVLRVAPFDGGRAWGTFGPYEWVEAIGHYAVDPEAAGNQRIVDLDLVPRDADGLVRFAGDVRILRPAASPGCGKLLVVIANRGTVGDVPFSAGLPPRLRAGPGVRPGDGHLLGRGWTIAWCGWQWDVISGPGRVGLSAPHVDVPPGWVRVEWRPDAPETGHELSESSPLFSFAAYPTADVGDPQATLSVRVTPSGPGSPVPRSSWRFSDAVHVEMDGGFLPFRWYQLVYRTSRCPVAGTGLLAVRDLVSGLRRSGITATFGFGSSQGGRFLRQFLWEGLNLDEHGDAVFDGVFSYAAGARRGEFNHRFAQPAVTHAAGFSSLPPYDTAGLLRRQRALGAVPKLFLVNTAWEYWRGDAGLVHVDPVTCADLPDDPDSRTYALAGLDHFGRLDLKDRLPIANRAQQLSPDPLLRALFAALDSWVSRGEEPPPSQVPRSAEGTAARRRDVLGRFASGSAPDAAGLEVPRAVDLGSGTDRGIATWPAVPGPQLCDVVSAVDADGNEVAGIRAPAVAVPLGVFTGWNPRRHIEGLPVVMYEFAGSWLPFPPGRPAAAERYGDRDEYRGRLVSAAEALIRRRLLLAEDVDWAVSEALELWDLPQ